MKKRLTNNWGLKLVSFIFAVLLWLVVVNVDNPVKAKPFDDITVKLLNTNIIRDEGLVYEILDSTDQVDVTVSAPRSYLELLSKDDIVAVADFNNITAANTINITYYSKRYNDKITNFKGSIESVKLNIEKEKTLKLVLKTEAVGEVMDGYVVGRVTTDQNQVRISGPESVVSQIKTAVVSVDVSGTTSNIATYADVGLYDADGNEIESESIKKNVDSVKVGVEILAKQTIPLKFSTMGAPADGYQVTGEIMSTPSEITIAGSADALRNITQLEIPAEALDITGITESLTQTINVKNYLPDGIILVDNENNGKVVVSVPIEAVEEKKLHLSKSNIVIMNVPEGYKASLEEGEMILSIAGLRSDVTAVMSSDIVGIIDLEAYMKEKELTSLEPGMYTVEITFDLGENIMITEPVRVGVTVEKIEEM